MPANDFEMNMQRKMEELKLDPSADVWQDVERRIRKEKKRRGIFFWLILAGILLGGGTIALLTINKNERNELTVNQTKTKDKSNSTSALKENSNTENPDEIKETIGTEVQTKDNKSEITLPANNKIKSGIPTSPPPLKKSNPKVKTSVESITKKEPDGKQVTGENSTTPKTEIVPESKMPVEKPVQKNKPEAEPILTVVASNDTSISTKIVEPKVEEKKITTAPVTQPVVMPDLKSDPTIKKEKKNDGKKIWEFWVQAGISGNVNGFRLFDNRLYTSALSTGSTPAASTTLKIKLKPGASFSTGVLLHQPLSPRLILDWGFGYAYLSTRILAGPLTDTTARITNPASADLVQTRFYPASGTLSSISNNYHFLGLSAELSWRIINKKNFSLYWDNGMSYKYLFASRVLHYDHGLKGYYEDPRLVNKHYMFASTGFSIPLSRTVTLRPFAEYSLTRVLKDHDTSGVHFTNYGLKFKFSLGRKK